VGKETGHFRTWQPVPAGVPILIINLYKHRGYIWRTALSDVRTRYAGSGLGPVWNILQPLALILVFTIVFSSIMRRDAVLGVHYTVYLCSALLPWLAFGECLNRGTLSFVHNAIYLRKLPIPEQVFVAQTALSSAISLTISFSLLMVLAIALGHYPSWHWLLLPIPLLLFVGMAFGFGMMLGTVNAFIRDVGQVVPVLIQIGFWSYPIVYHEEFLPARVQRILPYNPIYPFLHSIREIFIHRSVPDPVIWGQMFFWTSVAGVLGYLVLRRLRPELRDVI
jgi:lipopolysaccharide transport system permease protein